MALQPLLHGSLKSSKQRCLLVPFSPATWDKPVDAANIPLQTPPYAYSPGPHSEPGVPCAGL